MKSLELEEGAEEGFLEQVERILDGTGQPEGRRVEPILVPFDQDPEGVRPTRAALRNQGEVVGCPSHQPPWTPAGRGGFPTPGAGHPHSTDEAGRGTTLPREGAGIAGG